MWLLIGLGCAGEKHVDSDTLVTPATPVDIAPSADGWLRGDLHFHTNYSDDALEQGGDWMAGALEIADAWRDDAWVAAYPELAPDDHLQFVAVTDHRTVAGHADPDFTHDYLALLGGEEFGSDGHAGIWGQTTHIPHEPQAGESENQRIQDSIDEAHAQGALFSPNHPLYSGDLWGWDVSGFDAIEIWNGPWSLLSVETTTEQLDAWVAGKGVENPAIRVAVQAAGRGQNGQALRFWQALLSLGVHVPPVGGGDRHMLFPAGLPTTYVAAPSWDEAGVLQGIASGSTFVSRSPQGPQVLLTAVVDGVEHPMGAALPSGPVEVHWRAGRAAGGELRLIGAAVDPSMPDPEVLATFPLDGDDVAGVWTWTPPASGGWLHALVVDPLPEPQTEAFAALTATLLQPAEDDPLGIVGAIGPLVDVEVIGDPTTCNPAAWVPETFHCMPADTEPLATFYVPPLIQAYMAAEFEDRVATGMAMGAISAAFWVAQ